MVARILITQALVGGGDMLLRSSGHELVVGTGDGPLPRDELVALAADVDAIICLLSDQIDAAVLTSGSRLRVVGNVAVGVDNIDRQAAAAAGVAVVNTPGVLDAATADIAILLMLSARRRASEAEADLRAGRWTGWSLGDHLGLDLSGATIGLVGFGRVGRAVARRLHGFDATVLHHTRTDTGVAGWTPSLQAMAAQCDVLSIHVPATEATRHLVGADVLAALPEGAVVINTSWPLVACCPCSPASVPTTSWCSGEENGALGGQLAEEGLEMPCGEPGRRPHRCGRHRSRDAIGNGRNLTVATYPHGHIDEGVEVILIVIKHFPLCEREIDDHLSGRCTTGDCHKTREADAG